MKQSNKVSPSNYSFEDYFAAVNISDTTKSKLEQADILVLPHKYAANEYYFADESINFMKFCRLNDAKHNTDILSDDNNFEVRALHSIDIWMPIIWVSTELILPIALDLVTRYINDKIRGREKEKATVKMSMRVGSGDEIKEFNYDGDAKTFSETFGKIDVSEW